MNSRANHRRVFRTLAASTVACATLVWTGLTYGQAVPAPAAAPATTAAAPPPVTFPGSLVSAKNATRLTPTQVAALDKFAADAINTIAKSTWPSQVGDTRKQLEDNGGGPAGTISGDFDRQYALAVSNAAVKVMQSRDVRARTAVAVAVYRVTTRNKNAALVPVVRAMLADKSEPIVGWGVKCVRQLYPHLLTASPNDATMLAHAVIAAMRTYPQNAGILEDAFEGLSGDMVKQISLTSKPAMDAMIALLEARAQMFEPVQPGVLPEQEGSKFPAIIVRPKKSPANAPPIPNMESGIADFFALTAFKGQTMSPQQKAAAGRAIFDLLTQLNRLAPSLPPAADPNDEATRRGDLAEIMFRASSALAVMGRSLTQGGADLEAKAREYGQLAKAADDQPGLDQKLGDLEKAMTAAAILGPKPALAPTPAPAPVRPTPAQAPKAPASGAVPVRTGNKTGSAAPAGGNTPLNK